MPFVANFVGPSSTKHPKANKTHPTTASIDAFIDKVPQEEVHDDRGALLMHGSELREVWCTSSFWRAFTRMR